MLKREFLKNDFINYNIFLFKMLSYKIIFGIKKLIITETPSYILDNILIELEQNLIKTKEKLSPLYKNYSICKKVFSYMDIFRNERKYICKLTNK